MNENLMEQIVVVKKSIKEAVAPVVHPIANSNM